MRWTRKHTCLTMLAVAGAVLGVPAMHPVTTPDEFGPAGSAASVDPTSDRPDTDGAPAPGITRPLITLGNLDPPPDLPPPWGQGAVECVVIGWTGLAPGIRPATDANTAGGHPASVTWSPREAVSTARTAAATRPDRVSKARPRSPLRGALTRHDRPTC